jgi:hypothetical protein
METKEEMQFYIDALHRRLYIDSAVADTDEDGLDPTPDENEYDPIYEEHRQTNDSDWFGGIDAR